MHYVLAMAGKGRKARIQKLVDELAQKKTLNGEAREEEHLLKAALYMAGDRRYEKELQEPGPVARHRRAPQLLVLLLGSPPPRPHAEHLPGSVRQ